MFSVPVGAGEGLANTVFTDFVGVGAAFVGVGRAVVASMQASVKIANTAKIMCWRFIPPRQSRQRGQIWRWQTKRRPLARPQSRQL